MGFLETFYNKPFYKFYFLNIKCQYKNVKYFFGLHHKCNKNLFLKLFVVEHLKNPNSVKTKDF